MIEVQSASGITHEIHNMRAFLPRKALLSHLPCRLKVGARLMHVVHVDIKLVHLIPSPFISLFISNLKCTHPPEPSLSSFVLPSYALRFVATDFLVSVSNELLTRLFTSSLTRFPSQK